MVYHWNNKLLAFKQIEMTDELKKRIKLLKASVQKDIQIDGYVMPLPKDKYDRKKHLKQLIDCVSQTSIGRYVFGAMPLDTMISSFDMAYGAELLGIYVKEDKIINILPKTLCYPLHVQVNALVHEGMHAVHKQIEENIQNKLLLEKYSNLNLYDKFVLNFLSETACCINGQLAGLCVQSNSDKKVVDIRPLFYNPDYWKVFYQDALDTIKNEKHFDLCLITKHTPMYYAIAQEYFNLHPELRNAQLTRRIHKGWRLFANALTSDFECSSPQKISSQSICDSLGTKISFLAEQAVKIKI
ncbi:MAG: hypothetical protein IKV03_03875 [Alphaproteobacteria bacterium]|jgi:hypothetical protein|nr:hypothetical protein [Alphaproteobacteria bacterium]